jgi:hypothetical protein
MMLEEQANRKQKTAINPEHSANHCREVICGRR